MLARLEHGLPEGEGVIYEPKWDGFRCLAFVDPEEVYLHSRNERPLARYFPEVVAALHELPDVVLDGELVIRVEGRASFPALMARLHPARRRVQQLAAETPATYVAFDLLASDGADLTCQPFSVRRQRLATLLHDAPPRVCLTPQTSSRDEARGWLSAGPGAGVDGVVAKYDDQRYEPGRRSMVKVKNVRTADCVVAGLRVHPDGGVGSLLLGAYDGEVLRHVGVASSLARPVRAEMRQDLAPLVAELAAHPWELGFALEGGALGRLKGTAGRWSPDMPRDWVPLRPERVAEVSYDHLEGYRFRHPARFRRWRPDRDARSCTIEQFVMTDEAR